MRKKRLSTSINAGSMADIAFLLLIFFLVSTQILNDKGIKVILPDYTGDDLPQIEYDADILEIWINDDNQLLVDQNEIPITLLKDMVKRFTLNPSNNPNFASSPKRAVVTINSGDKTHYESYVQIYAEVKQAYIEMWTEQAQFFYGRPIRQLSIDEIKEIKERIPLQISEVEKRKL